MGDLRRPAAERDRVGRQRREAVAGQLEAQGRDAAPRVGGAGAGDGDQIDLDAERGRAAAREQQSGRGGVPQWAQVAVTVPLVGVWPLS
jgi:hypothetical protein